jgi:carboxypeptidase Q
MDADRAAWRAPARNVPAGSLVDPRTYRDAAARLIGEALVDRTAWDKLAYLGDAFGHRMNGTPGQQLSIDWAVEAMRREGLENVRTEKVVVPNWIRGTEKVTLLDPYPRDLVMVGYGNSVGTGPEGIVADAIVVRSFEELESRRAEVPGKIVVFSPLWQPFAHDESWENYLALRHFRISGHARAAEFGALAVLLRSIYKPHARQAHTGSLKYIDGIRRIPSAALAPEDALMLERIHARGGRTRLHLVMNAQDGGWVDSGNVVGELVGRERPEEIIVLGCQYDSWDNGTSSLDDGCGAIVVWEALRLIAALGLRPRRTIRTVLFTNEENGCTGGMGYRDLHAAELHNHVAMLEADSGVLPPLQFRVSGTPTTIATVTAIAELAEIVGYAPVGSPVRIGTAEDIHPTVEAGDIASLTLQGNNEPYSVYHHAAGDMVEAVPPCELARGVAGVAVMAYVLAEMPQRLPRGKGEGARGTSDA